MSLIRINRQPSRQQLAVFGVIWLAFFGILGWAIWNSRLSPTLAFSVWAVGAVVPALGLAVPAFMRLVYLGMAYAAFPIGFVLSHLLVAIVFYAVLTPIAFLLRIVHHDPLSRHIDRDADTYWTDRQVNTDIEQYFRQF